MDECYIQFGSPQYGLLNRRWELLCWNQGPQLIAVEVPEDIDAVLRASDPQQTHQDAIRRLNNVDEPFELSFQEVRWGAEISIAKLRGQVVVIDFWSKPKVGVQPTSPR